HGITPKTIRKEVRGVIRATVDAEEEVLESLSSMKPAEREAAIAKLEEEMKQAARDLQFERAAELRDLILELKVGS
ncbi:UvrB/UvrC motif-containing protein, partial [Exiguobacterium alkaliphilum]